MVLTWPRRGRAIGFCDSMGLLGVTIFLVARFIPVEALPFWRCMVRDLSGWPCLGCGLTRAAQHLTHGELGAAFAIQPLGTILYLALGLAAIAAALRLLTGLPLPAVALRCPEARGARLAILAVVALNYAWVAWNTG